MTLKPMARAAAARAKLMEKDNEERRAIRAERARVTEETRLALLAAQEREAVQRDAVDLIEAEAKARAASGSDVVRWLVLELDRQKADIVELKATLATLTATKTGGKRVTV